MSSTESLFSVKQRPSGPAQGIWRVMAQDGARAGAGAVAAWASPRGQGHRDTCQPWEKGSLGNFLKAAPNTSKLNLNLC